MARRETSVYANIAIELENKIKSGAFKEGAVIPSERILKDIYKVERTTIRRALEILQEKGLIIKKAGVGSVVASEEDAVAVQESEIHTVTKKSTNDGSVKSADFSGKVLYVFPDAQTLVRQDMPLMRKAVLAVKDACKANNLLFEIVEDINDLDTKLNKDVYGVVFSESIDEDVAADLQHKKIPYVLYMGRGDHITSVGVDNYGAVSLILNELYNRGHKNIAFVGADDAFYIERTLRVSFERYMRVNLGVETELVNAGGSDEQSGYNRTKELLRYSKENFTAVVAVNDDVARGAVKALEEKGKRVPEDVSVTGIGGTDGNIYSAGFDFEKIGNEVIFALYKAKKIGCTGSFTEYNSEFVGNTIADAPKQRSGKLSDFLL